MAPNTPSSSTIDSGVDRHHKDLGEYLKVDTPGPFDGTTGKLRGFLTQLKTYHKFFPVRLHSGTDKVLHAGTCLTGAALQWFEPILRDYLEKDNENREGETKTIFATFRGFEKAITGAFGDVDETRMAIQKIQELRQRGSASDYAATFRQLSTRTEWDDEPLMTIFYQGLKEEVKDELYKQDLPATLAEYIAHAVRIDNRQYERRREKQGGRKNWTYVQSKKPQANQGKKRQQYNNTAWAHTTNPGPMELDAMKKDKKDITCYNCNKKGHFARECKGPKKNNGWTPVQEGKKHLNMTRSGYDESSYQEFCKPKKGKSSAPQPQPEHGLMSWTACYDDNCNIHKSDKLATGWFPKQVRRTMAALVRKETGLQEVSSEEEYSSDSQGTSDQEDFNRQAHDLLDQYDGTREPPEEMEIWEEQVATTLARRLTPGDDGETQANQDSGGSVPEDEASSDATESVDLTEKDWETILSTPEGREKAINEIYDILPNGTDDQILIRATSFRGVKQKAPREEEPSWALADPKLKKEHEYHDEISWISCVYDECITHLWEKGLNNTFPIYNENLKEAYPEEEGRAFEIAQRYSNSIVRLALKDTYPRECVVFDSLEDCPRASCEIHKNQKAYQWHEYRSRKLYHDAQLEVMRREQEEARHRNRHPNFRRLDMQYVWSLERGQESLDNFGKLYPCKKCNWTLNLQKKFEIVHELTTQEFDFTTMLADRSTNRLWQELRKGDPVCYHPKNERTQL